MQDPRVGEQPRSLCSTWIGAQQASSVILINIFIIMEIFRLFVTSASLSNYQLLYCDTSHLRVLFTYGNAKQTYVRCCCFYVSWLFYLGLFQAVKKSYGLELCSLVVYLLILGVAGSQILYEWQKHMQKHDKHINIICTRCFL